MKLEVTLSDGSKDILEVEPHQPLYIQKVAVVDTTWFNIGHIKSGLLIQRGFKEYDHAIGYLNHLLSLDIKWNFSCISDVSQETKDQIADAWLEYKGIPLEVYDLQCAECEKTIRRERRGMVDLWRLYKLCKETGWQYHKKTGRVFCPDCIAYDMDDPYFCGNPNKPSIFSDPRFSPQANQPSI